ncbi:uncharacterized protein ARB_07235 [Trichophyton benhamiae CBS 112371]|uniref:Uncharacterized protein n=1 Tax=Arthroderma benhamiae (strain ATCC MYA-4681 / CBS 112371) TaxID=663331 RepID=D4ASM0_ARTBC|nr:uncharacterized protein ARB_07235 [Trichophyton benhamiae CBS 112371]EFE33770.1 hypothetical protein ARB_07235 [Trichophyton benhamiae CBS 112371]
MMLLGLVLFLQPKHEHGRFNSPGSTTYKHNSQAQLTKRKKLDLEKWENSITALEWSLIFVYLFISVCLSIGLPQHSTLIYYSNYYNFFNYFDFNYYNFNFDYFDFLTVIHLTAARLK